LDIATLEEKKNKAEQQAEYYQRKADAEPNTPDANHESSGPSGNYTPMRQTLRGHPGSLLR